jgi:uncharacterized damage-inducible protein DinB
LRQLAEVVGSLTDEQYGTRPVGVIPSSIGGHVRHCLEHVDALLAGIDDGAVDYDQRHRGSAVETCRSLALETLARQERQLLALPSYPESLPLRLSLLLSSYAAPVQVETTLGRELGYVLSHTIHHNALIGVMVRLLGVAAPNDFGYAPSTIAYREKSACVR